MRELIYYVAASVDGFIADAEGGFDAFLAEGDHMSVVLGDYADALPAHVHAALGVTPPGTRFDTVVMGWNTLTPALEAGIASPYPHLRQLVASRQPREVDPSITLTSDAVMAVRSLKRDEGLDIWLCGGGELAGSLLSEIDRLVVKRNPVVFGVGRPMFAGATTVGRFDLALVRSFESGVVIEEYVARR